MATTTTTTTTTTTSSTTTTTTTTTAPILRTKTSVCNMALARIGATRIDDYDDTTDTSLSAIHCRLQYEQTARALQRSHWWRFAKTRAALRGYTTPDFEWDYAFRLPQNFLREISVYAGDDTITGRPITSYELSGKVLLTNDSSVNLRYIQYVDDPDDWDELFVEVFVLTLARKLIIPLAVDLKLKKDLDEELVPLMRKVRALDRNEQRHIGRLELKTFDDARHSDYP